MSWSLATQPVAPEDAEAAIDALDITTQLVTGQSPMQQEAMFRQFAAAKAAAKALVATVPGPYVAVALYGHANGTGATVPSGYAADTVGASVVQCVSPL